MAFNFGTPAGNAGSGFSFGASTPKPAFGAAAAPTFGTSTPAFGGAAPAFGAATPATAAAPAFGANLTLSTTQPTTGLLGGFGAPSTAVTTTTAAPSTFGGFGTTPALGFNQLGAKPTGTVQPLSLSAATASVAPVLPTFGQATAAQAPTLTLGGLGGLGGTAAAAPATSAFSFGATAAPQATVAPTLGGFGAAASAAPSLGMFGKPITSTTTTASAIPSLFGAASAAAPAPAGGLFGATAVPAVAAPASTGLFGANTSSLFAAPTANTTGLSASNAPAPKLGLGGVDTNAAQPKTVEGRSESARAKEAQVPQEIVATVESLKQHIKQQKQYSSDIARTSTRKLMTVSDELQSLNWALTEVANCVHTNHTAIKQLRYETAGAIRQAEMAQRTHDIQPGLQFENNAPLLFFMELVQRFEADMISFRNQVELTEKHMRSLANPQSFSADDLKKGLQQIHESFIALAGRLHETHQKVEAQKEQYLNLRKHLLHDKTNVFEEEASAERQRTTLANSSSGPTPFTSMFGINLGVSSSGPSGGGAALNQTGAANVNDVSGFGLLGRSQAANSFFGQTQGTSFGFGASGGAQTTSLSTTGGGAFNLQNPPIGSKRNKQ